MAEITTQNPIAGAPTEEQITTLIAKHRVEIDRILARGSEGQQKEVEKLGLSPEALEAHYPDLQARAAQLDKQTQKANAHATYAGWATFTAVAGGLLAMGKKFAPSRFVRAAFISTFSIIAGFLGAAGWSSAFNNGLRQKNKQLLIDTRNSLERELAIAIEKSTQEKTPTQEAQRPLAEGFAASVATKSSPQPRENSYVAAAAQEKAQMSSETRTI